MKVSTKGPTRDTPFLANHYETSSGASRQHLGNGKVMVFLRYFRLLLCAVGLAFFFNFEAWHPSRLVSWGSIAMIQTKELPGERKESNNTAELLHNKEARPTALRSRKAETHNRTSPGTATLKLQNYWSSSDRVKDRTHNGTGVKGGKIPNENATRETLKRYITPDKSSQSSVLDMILPGTPCFVSYPFRHVGIGDEEAACTWKRASGFMNITASAHNISVVGPSTSPQMDVIQRAAVEEGVCVPHINASEEGLHIFSREQAQTCLSSVNLTITGDSYTKQLFIGLRDILLGDPSNIEIQGSVQRNQHLKQAKNELQAARNNDKSFPSIEFLCDAECYGKPISRFENECFQCLLNVTKGENGANAVFVVGIGVHMFNELERDQKLTAELLRRFFGKHLDLKVIWVSMPSYKKRPLPDKYKNMMMVKGDEIHDLYVDLMNISTNLGRPFLDYYQLTYACIENGCSVDGGHRTRYVNRWKAQLLLNLLCTMDSSSVQLSKRL